MRSICRLMLAISILAVTCWAQTAATPSPNPDKPAVQSEQKAQCSCCAKMANDKEAMACCHHKNGDASKSCCNGKDGMSCMKGDTSANAGCCNGKSCDRKSGKGCCAGSEKSATMAKACCGGKCNMGNHDHTDIDR